MTYHRKNPPQPLVVPDGPLGDVLLRPCDAAAFLAVSEATLGNWRAREVGPSWIRMPSRGANPAEAHPGPGHYMVRYRLSDVVAMIDKMRVTLARMPHTRAGRPAGWTRDPERWESTSELVRKRLNALRQRRLRARKAREDPADPEHEAAVAAQTARNDYQRARWRLRKTRPNETEPQG